MAWATLPLAAQEPAAEASVFEIGSINQTKSTGWVKVDNGWVQNVDLVKVKFRHNGPQPLPVPDLTVYLFNKEGKLLRKLSGVPRIQSRDGTDNSKESRGGYQDLPDKLEPRKAYELFYPIPPSLNAGELRIKTFVMEIKDGGKVVRRAYPASQTDLSQLDFNGKPVTGIAEAVAAEGGDGAAPGQATTSEVKFRSITRFRNSRNAMVNKNWVEGLQTIRAKFDLVSGSQRGTMFVRAYFYDDKGKQLYELKEPPQVEASPEVYVSMPPIFKDGESYEFLFPIWDEKSSMLEEKVATSIVVFGNKEAADAGIYPSTRKLEEFDFPEKGLVLKK